MEGLVKGEMDQTEAPWIDIQNRGSLFYPSDSLVRTISTCEERFLSFHGKDINRDHDPIGRTVMYIMEDKSIQFPRSVVNLFVKIRFFQRIKILNDALKFKHKTNNVRSFKQKAQFTF